MFPTFRLASAVLLSLGTLHAAHAAQQCFVSGSGGATTYGAVTATVSGTCQDNTITQGPFEPGTAQLTGGAQSCTYTFDKPLQTSTVSIKAHGIRTLGSSLRVRLNGDLYQSVAADIGEPLAGSSAINPLVIKDTGYTGTASPFSSGTLTLTNNPPATVNSITVAMSGGWPGWVQVCADDGAVTTPVAPTVSVPVPTLSEWNLVLTSGLLAGVGFFAFMRKKRTGRSAA